MLCQINGSTRDKAQDCWPKCYIKSQSFIINSRCKVSLSEINLSPLKISFKWNRRLFSLWISNHFSMVYNIAGKWNTTGLNNMFAFSLFFNILLNWWGILMNPKKLYFKIIGVPISLSIIDDSPAWTSCGQNTPSAEAPSFAGLQQFHTHRFFGVFI